MVSILERKLLFLSSFLFPLLGFLLAKCLGKDSEADQVQRELAMKCAGISSFSLLLMIGIGVYMCY